MKYIETIITRFALVDLNIKERLGCFCKDSKGCKAWEEDFSLIHIRFFDPETYEQFIRNFPELVKYKDFVLEVINNAIKMEKIVEYVNEEITRHT